MDTISFPQLAYLLLLWGGMALFGAVTTQILKTPVRIAWKRRKALRGDSLALYTWTIRTVPIVFCVIASAQMGVWPDWVSIEWGMILGATAGMLSVVVYHAVIKAVPKAIAVLPEALRKRLGG